MKRTKNKKNFIERIADEAVDNMLETYDQTGKTGTIIRYGDKDYRRIQELLYEINSITSKDNVGVSVDDKQLEKNEVRFYFLETSIEKLQGGW